MKILLDIDDQMGLHLMAIIKKIPYIKAQQLTDAKANLLKEVREAVIEMQEIKSGKKKAKDIKDLFK